MANPNFSVEKDMNLSSVNCETLEVGGDLTVGGAIRPGTFTNRVVTLVDAAAVGAITGGPVTVAQSGTTFVIPALTIGAQTLALPAAAPGLRYTFAYNQSTGAIAQTLTISVAGTDTYSGFVVGVDGAAGTTAINHTALVFAAGCVAGGFVEFEGLATGSTTAPNAWHISGQCAAAAQITSS